MTNFSHYSLAFLKMLVGDCEKNVQPISVLRHEIKFMGNKIIFDFFLAEKKYRN